MILPITPTALAVAAALDREAFSRPQGSEFTIKDLMLAVMEGDAMQKVDTISVQETSALLRAVGGHESDRNGTVSFVSVLAAGGFAATTAAVLDLKALRFSMAPEREIGEAAVRVGAALAKSWPNILANIDMIINQQARLAKRKEDS